MQHGQRIERGKRTDNLFIRIYMSWRYHTLFKPAASTRSTSTTNNSGGLLVPRKRRFLLCMSWDLRLTGAACFLISRSANWFSFSKEYTSTLTWLIAIYSPSWNVNKKGACHFRSYRLERMLDRAHGSTLNIVALLNRHTSVLYFLSSESHLDKKHSWTFK
ncbi:hypothetical protein ABG067_003657 [Albugo candida]